MKTIVSRYIGIACVSVALVNCADHKKEGSEKNAADTAFVATEIKPEPELKPHMKPVAAAKTRLVKEPITKAEREFLLKTVDARLMDIQEGKQAQKRGTIPAIKEYGDLMVREQTQLLIKLRAATAGLDIDLPYTLSQEKLDGLDELTTTAPEDFDKKFEKMMTIDHKRDVRLFEEAKDFKNGRIRSFATAYLPEIQDHLAKIESIWKKN